MLPLTSNIGVPLDPMRLRVELEKANLRKWEASFTREGKNAFKFAIQELVIDVDYELKLFMVTCRTLKLKRNRGLDLEIQQGSQAMV